METERRLLLPKCVPYKAAVSVVHKKLCFESQGRQVVDAAGSKCDIPKNVDMIHACGRGEIMT